LFEARLFPVLQLLHTNLHVVAAHSLLDTVSLLSQQVCFTAFHLCINAKFVLLAQAVAIALRFDNREKMNMVFQPVLHCITAGFCLRPSPDTMLFSGICNGHHNVLNTGAAPPGFSSEWSASLSTVCSGKRGSVRQQACVGTTT
jgi:hypothetical protein